jgi:hypothetical protein
MNSFNIENESWVFWLANFITIIDSLTVERDNDFSTGAKHKIFCFCSVDSVDNIAQTQRQQQQQHQA